MAPNKKRRDAVAKRKRDRRTKRKNEKVQQREQAINQHIEERKANPVIRTPFLLKSVYEAKHPDAHKRELWQQVVDLTNMEPPVRLVLEHQLSPGDVVMMTAVLRDLHHHYPNLFLTDVRTSCNELFEGNPYITEISDGDPRAVRLKVDYPLIHECNEGGFHFAHGCIDDLNHKLGINVSLTKLRGDIPISDEEKSWYSQVREILGKDVPYWIVDAGCKHDYTCKMWEFARYQEVVNRLPDVTFVQIGSDEENHFHHELRGDNVINLIGKTGMRELVRLVYHSFGVLTPVSLPMHLAAAIEMPERYDRWSRPCVVVAGGREPPVWEMYTNHAFLHTCGKLPCCQNGGCWRSRIEALDDDDTKNNDLCVYPVTTATGQVIPKCLDMITVDDVCRAIQEYIDPGVEKVEEPSRFATEKEMRSWSIEKLREYATMFEVTGRGFDDLVEKLCAKGAVNLEEEKVEEPPKDTPVTPLHLVTPEGDVVEEVINDE